MQTLTKPATLDTIVKNSLFRAHATPIGSPEDALTFLDTIRNPDASHNCWAYRIGQSFRSHDDGEPGGTAGRPILQAIDMLECDRVMVVVTRWFGGTKLGAGGLVRAYGGAAAACLRTAETTPLIPMATLRFHCPFSTIAIIQARLDTWQAHQKICDFDAEGATLTLEVPEQDSETIQSTLRDLTRGQSTIHRLD